MKCVKNVKISNFPSLLVHCWFIVGSLLVHCWFIVGSLLLHCCFIVGSLLVHFKAGKLASWQVGKLASRGVLKPNLKSEI